MSDPGKVKRATQFEAKTFIQPNRGKVVTEHVQKRRVSPLHNLSAQGFHEPTGKSSATPVFIYTNGAYLNVAVEAHPFAGHCNETPLVANANVVSHLTCSLAERTGFGLPDEIEHIFRIHVAQLDHLLSVRASGFLVLSDHLMDDAHMRYLQRIDSTHRIQGLQNGLFVRQQKLVERAVGSGGCGRQSSEGSHIGMVSTGKLVSAPKMGLPGRKRRPDRAVEASVYRTIHILSFARANSVPAN
jgi:hypothetical protein